jgi:hypothetical protein
MLREALFADLLKNLPISDAQLQERYNQTQSKFAGTKDIHARQITVGSEADALKIIDSLKKGAKFDDWPRHVRWIRLPSKTVATWAGATWHAWNRNWPSC